MVARGKVEESRHDRTRAALSAELHSHTIPFFTLPSLLRSYYAHVPVTSIIKPHKSQYRMVESLEDKSRSVQERTFCKWYRNNLSSSDTFRLPHRRLNTKLEMAGYPPMTSLVRDLSDGVRLIQLMEIMGDVNLGRYNKSPRMRVQKAENVSKALDFITSRGVKLMNIGPEDIVDGNIKLILGMIWTLILRFTIADISEEGLSAKDGLLLWCQRKTEPYKEVDVQDFSLSWSDGLALCALIHCHRPDLLDYDRLDKSDRHGNTRLAFTVAAQHLGIPQLLEVEDLCDASRPDEKSVMTYIASFFHAFSSMDQAETVSRRVEKFAELMQSVWVSRNDYERRVRLLLVALSEIQTNWAASAFTGTYPDAKHHSNDFNAYKQTTKRTWVVEKQDVATLFGNVQTKLRTYGLREYVPPPELTLAEVDAAWTSLLASEARRSRAINAQIRQIKERLRKSFADLANDFEHRLRTISSALAALEGPLEVQQQRVEEIKTRLPAVSEDLAKVAAAEAECNAANVEENDYTVFTCQDLEFELELVEQSIAKKMAFIDNQIVSRNLTNLTPAQLEQFESTFRYFDKDETNTLSQSEMAAALASLGIVYSDEDLDFIFDQLTSDYGAINFEAFINLLVDITEDQTSPEQLREAFRGIAADKVTLSAPYVTELDLRLHHLPAASIEYLSEVMPRAQKDSTAGDAEYYDYELWLDNVSNQVQPHTLPSPHQLPTMASGVTVNPDCLDQFSVLKLKKTFKYIIFALNKENTEIVVEKTSASQDYEEFIKDLPETECRWAIYDLEFEKEGGGKRNKIVFYSWSPDDAKVRAKMVAASSKDALRRSLVGIAVEVQGTDFSEIAYEVVLDKANKGA
ncbi:putative actin cross-linking [Mycena indigotica]|uniref:Cofilin n=1 Tax=Mycena indigotica TaxID=2126181 RepID=A0A8H6SH91_9AGAR|nr:putative actin cross-linking [Mycena indigotica]KAF7298852.1 putative actin cross-linking [Mycena indigotica]